MGMDVYGRNPKQNKPMSDFPTYEKWNKIPYGKRDKIKWEKEQEQFYTEMQNYEDVNIGTYFRNNCWWWRPLWNYCYQIADDLISEELFESGHGNSGAGLDDKGAKLLGLRLIQHIREGKTIQYQASYQQYLDDLPDNDCFRCNNNNRGNNKKKECTNCNKTGKTTNFNKNYPFDIDNVKQFAEFCLQSGGFKIC